MSVASVFRELSDSIARGQLIKRPSSSDKEFHFQNWIGGRLDNIGAEYDEPGRNTYPDFRLVHEPIGFEVKGLAYPGRDKNYDSNSQVPTGLHHGRTIFYIFGRYPKEPDGDEYPVVDLTVCHGDFLNATNAYVHKNSSFKGFGSYGDILVRDRKMYVVPTPFALANGLAHHVTLILPRDYLADDDFHKVGDLDRREVDRLIVSYEFDLQTNRLVAKTAPNPTSGQVHRFVAYRLKDAPKTEVSLRSREEVLAELSEVEGDPKGDE